MHLHEVLLVWIVCHMHLLHPLYGQVKHCNGRSSIVMTDQALCWQLKPCCSKCITYRQHKILFPQYYNDSLQGNKWLQCLLQEKSKVILQSCLLLEANPTGRLFAHGCFHKQRGKHMVQLTIPSITVQVLHSYPIPISAGNTTDLQAVNQCFKPSASFHNFE